MDSNFTNCASTAYSRECATAVNVIPSGVITMRKTLSELEAYKLKDIQNGWQEYIPVEAACSKCGHQLYKNTSIILTSYPPQYQYRCLHCGNVETSRLSLPMDTSCDGFSTKTIEPV